MAHLPGPAGAPGTPGAAGTAGPIGLQGATGATNVVVRRLVLDQFSGTLSRTVLCQPGERAVGGGAWEYGGMTSPLGFDILLSAPVTGPNPLFGIALPGEGATPTGWATELNATGTSTAWFYAVCAKP